MPNNKATKKACHKVGYPNKDKARQALKDFGKVRGAKRFYKCPHHQHEMWHLTSEKRS